MMPHAHNVHLRHLVCAQALALLLILLLPTLGLAVEANDAITPGQEILELSALTTRLKQESELKTREIELWKTKYQILEERYQAERLWHIIRDIEEEVGNIRSLLPKPHVTYRIVDEQELERFIMHQIDKQYGAQHLDDYEMVMRLLGFWRTRIDLKQLIFDLYSEQAMGVYDLDSRKLLLRPFFDPEEGFGRTIIAHEICHALQDQHFDLARILKDRMDNDDALLAALCVIEGDATLIMSDYMSRHLSPALLLEVPKYLSYDQSTLMNAPYFIRQTLLFPYLQGFMFVSEALRRKGSIDADDIFRDIPCSTEQILHPEKYFVERDNPTSLVLFDYSNQLGPDWRLAYTNVHGEYAIRLLFEEELGAREASVAAAGWDGDRYVLYRRAMTSYWLYWESVWDTQDDAEEFFTNLQRLVKTQHSEAEIADMKGAVPDITYKTTTDWIRLLWLDKRVYLFLYNDKAALPAINQIGEDLIGATKM